MGGFTAKPRQGILIDGKRFKDGSYLRRKSKVEVSPPDGKPGRGVKLAVRLADNQDVLELTVDGTRIDTLPRDPDSERQLDKNDPAAGEKWIVWRVPREALPANPKAFRTTFKLARPTGVQSAKWAVVYDDEEFTGGYVIFGNADVGWSGAESPAAASKHRPRPHRKTGRGKRKR